MKKLIVLCLLGLTMVMVTNTESFAAAEKGAKKCSDLIDNDGDGFIDADDPDCGGGGDGGGGDTFTVNVFFDGSAIESGSAMNVPGKVHGQRRTLNETPMTLQLTGLPRPPGCTTTFGMENASFSLTTYRNKQSGEFTFVTANFRDFVVMGESYGLRFDNGVIANPDNWLPVPGMPNSLSGDQLTLSLQSSTGDEDCNGQVPRAWTISVENEAPVVP